MKSFVLLSSVLSSTICIYIADRQILFFHGMSFAPCNYSSWSSHFLYLSSFSSVFTLLSCLFDYLRFTLVYLVSEYFKYKTDFTVFSASYQEYQCQESCLILQLNRKLWFLIIIKRKRHIKQLELVIVLYRVFWNHAPLLTGNVVLSLKYCDVQSIEV